MLMFSNKKALEYINYIFNPCQIKHSQQSTEYEFPGKYQIMHL